MKKSACSCKRFGASQSRRASITIEVCVEWAKNTVASGKKPRGEKIELLGPTEI